MLPNIPRTLYTVFVQGHLCVLMITQTFTLGVTGSRESQEGI